MKKKWFLTLLFFGMMVCMSAQEKVVHTVIQGDTVYSIAKRYGTTVDAVFALNPGAVSGIEIDTILIISEGKSASKNVTTSGKTVTPPKTITKDAAKEVDKVLSELDKPLEKVQEPKFKTHKVRRKETLYSISKKYSVAVDDIKKYNKKLYSNELRKGDKIRIPIYDDKYLKNKINGSSRLSRTTKYNIKPKETKFGIARRHGITVSELESLNPGVGEILSVGQELIVPTAILVPYEEEKDPRFKLYEVQPKETVYSLLRTLEISGDSLDVLNPYLKVEGLKAGMILRVPKKGRLDSLAIDYAGGMRINLEDRLSNFKPKKIALMLPFHLDRLKLDSVAAVEGRMKKDRVLRISLDFYAGVLMAVNHAKSKGISTDLSVYDTENSKKKILGLISKNNFDELDAVIGPLYQKNIETVANELKKYETPVFSPISNKESKLYNNFFQTMPSNVMLEDKLINFVLRDTLPKNVIIIADAKHEGVKDKLKAKFPNAKVVKPQKENFIYENDIVKVLDEKLRNWVFIESSDIPLISNVTPYLNARAESHKITLFTTDRNDAFDSEAIQNAHLSKLQLHYPSIDKEYNDKPKKSFVANFKKKYGMLPNQYAIRGYDIAYDVLMRLGSADDLYHAATFEGTTEYIENKFNYGKKALGGYYNKASYLIKYDKNLMLMKVE